MLTLEFGSFLIYRYIFYKYCLQLNKKFMKIDSQKRKKLKTLNLLMRNK